MVRYALILFACSFLASHGVHAAGDGEQFLNVKQWKGHLDIRVKETFHGRRSWEAGHEERNLNSTRTFRIALRTGNGTGAPVDPFVAQKEPKPAPVEKGDKFEGMDFDKMQRAMKRSGIDPAMMGTIMKEMNKMKGLHISAGKYKQWAETSFKSNTTGNWLLTDITRGEGMDTSGKRCSYSNRKKVEGVPDGTGGMTLVVNLQKKAYSFKWELARKKPQKASELVVREDSCEGNSRKARKINYGNRIAMEA